MQGLLLVPAYSRLGKLNNLVKVVCLDFAFADNYRESRYAVKIPTAIIVPIMERPTMVSSVMICLVLFVSMNENDF